MNREELKAVKEKTLKGIKNKEYDFHTFTIPALLDENIKHDITITSEELQAYMRKHNICNSNIKVLDVFEITYVIEWDDLKMYYDAFTLVEIKEGDKTYRDMFVIELMI